MYWKLFFLPVLAMLLVTDGRVQAQSDFGSYPPIAAQAGSRPSYLGVNLVDMNADRAARWKLSEEQGVEVVSVEEGTPAENAGIKAGDVLLSYNGETILGTHQFSRLVRETPPGRKVKIQLWRDGKPQSVVASIGIFPSAIPANSANISIPDMRGFRTANIPGVLMVWNNMALGIECEALDFQLAQYFGVNRGILVRGVAKDSAGDKAGIKAGDVLVSAGTKSLVSPEELGRFLRQNGKPVQLSVVRDHKRLALTVTLPSEDQ